MKLTKIAVAMVLAGMTSFVSQAIPITGGISLAGGETLNGSLGSATAFTAFTGVHVESVSGSYVGVPTSGNPGSPDVTMTPFGFNPFSGSVIPLWTFNYGGDTYSFDLTSLTIDFQSSTTLALRGSGMLHITGLTDTIGDWVFTANSLGNTFSFSSSNAAVPDGGLTVMLLGAGLASLGMVRRFWKH